MKVLNTVSNPILWAFNRGLVKASAPPHPAAEILFRKAARLLSPLVASVGKPAVQLFGQCPFEYGGRPFGIDVTWCYPDGAIDGINASLMVEDAGRGLQFILFDHQRGTIHDMYFLPNNLAADIRAVVRGVENYCAANRGRPSMVP